MTKHKHAEMIKAKADNMELVKFIKDGDKWIIDNLGSCHFDDMCEYFLCLPQHNENGQCLHWLNGGEANYKPTENTTKGVSYYWEKMRSKSNSIAWSPEYVWMSDKYEIRIKPRKEKRWIGVNHSGYVMPIHCGSIDSAKQHASHCDASVVGDLQFIEIEVEI